MPVPLIAAAGASIGAKAGSALAGLFGPKRASSGAKQSIVNDEKAAVDRYVAAGDVNALRTFIGTTMQRPAGTPWGTAYSPEAIEYALGMLSNLQQRAGPSSLAAASAGVPTSSATLAPGTTAGLPTPSSLGAMFSNPLVLVLVVVLVGVGAFLFFRRRKR